MRITLAATVVVAVALVVGAFVLIDLQRSLLTEQVDDKIETRSGDIGQLVAGEEDPSSLDIARQDEALVQILDEDGEVVAASENVRGEPPVSNPDDTSVGLRTVGGLPIEDDEQFRVITSNVLSGDDLYTVIVAGSLEPIDENVEVLTQILRVAVPVLLAMVALIAWLVVGRALRPVDAMRAEVDSITDQRLDRRVPVPRSHDEIGRLARTMNVMLSRLQASWARQEQLVADASHELRSPLTAMRAQLEVDRAHPETADREQTRDELLREIDQLQRLIDDLLFLARTDAQAAREALPVDLDDLVLREAARLRPDTAVVIDTAGVSAGQVSGDASDLQRLVRNLLDNAVRHAAHHVSISLAERDEAVELVVNDDGPGVPEEAREQVFERFTRLDGSRARGEGTGLGLAIARGIVDQHGGTISVGAAPTGGASFLVSVPRTPARMPSSAP
jgi:signal transduction histidine kinase